MTDKVHDFINGSQSHDDDWPNDQRGDAWKGNGAADQGQPEPPPEAPGFQFRPITTRKLLTTPKPQWDVNGIVVSGQNMVVGGGKKTLKTGICTDLSISLATKLDFLGKFKVERIRRVVFLSGESGEWTLSETTARVMAAKGIDPDERLDNLLWQFDLPKFGSTDMFELERGLREVGAEVVIIDPLYLCTLVGMDASMATNLYAMGPLLRSAAQVCKAVGATPILVHHFKQHTGRERFEPPQLEDLAFAGIQEFARQWLLLGRRAAFVPGTGQHELWLAVGGSTGHSGLWGLDIEEGVLRPDFTGRTWKVSVATLSEAQAIDDDKRQAQKDAKQHKKDHDDDAAVMGMVDRLDPDRLGVGKERLKKEGETNQPRLPKGRVDAALARLLTAGILVPTMVAASIGSNAQRKVAGVRRPREDDHPPEI